MTWPANGSIRLMTGTMRVCVFCRITQLIFLRLITTEAVMGKDEVLSQRQAWNVYDQWFEDSRDFILRGTGKFGKNVSRNFEAGPSNCQRLGRFLLVSVRRSRRSFGGHV